MIDLNTLSLPELYRTLAQGGEVARLVDAAMAEDVDKAGDITTDSIIDAADSAVATVAMRCEGVVAGLATLGEFGRHAPGVSIDVLCKDGESCKAGAAVAVLRGSLRGILRIERPLLNLLGRLSGIATLTRQYVDAIKGHRAVICDTRKTTPGMRMLEKYAVRCGGGTLHRLGLSDAALFKDNHVAGIPLEKLAATLRESVQRVRHHHEVRFVEVEVDSLEQLEIVLHLEKGLVDIVLLDNMSVTQLIEAVAKRQAIAPTVALEASGGITLENVRIMAETGVDRISIGAITHSAPWLDIGLDIAT